MIWVRHALVIAVHNSQLQKHGGLPGVADPRALEAALNRPQQLLAYEPQATVWQLAARYAEAIVAAHAFNDANKRTAFIVAATFLEMSDFRLEPNQLEIVTTMTAVAEHTISSEELAEWMRINSRTIAVPNPTDGRPLVDF
jgi:death on curing protein